MTHPNVEDWTRANAEYTDARAEQAWGEEINWGVWHIPETELHALPDAPAAGPYLWQPAHHGYLPANTLSKH